MLLGWVLLVIGLLLWMCLVRCSLMVVVAVLNVFFGASAVDASIVGAPVRTLLCTNFVMLRGVIISYWLKCLCLSIYSMLALPCVVTCLVMLRTLPVVVLVRPMVVLLDCVSVVVVWCAILWMCDNVDSIRLLLGFR